MEVFGIAIPVTTILITILIVVLTYMYLTWGHGYWEKRGIPGPKPYPLTGTLHHFFTKSFIEMDTENVSKYGKVIGGYLGRTPILYIADANIIKRIMVKDFNYFTDRSLAGRGITQHEKYIAQMLNNLEGDEWKRVRNTITPAFSTSKLKGMVQSMNNCCNDLVDCLQKSEDTQIEVKKYTDAFTIDAIARVGFGVETDAQKNPKNPFLVNGRKILDFNFARKAPVIFLLLLVPSFYKWLNSKFPESICLFPQEATNYFLNLIREIMKHRSGDTKGNRDLIQLMLNAHNMEQTADEVDTEIGGTADKLVNKKGLNEDEIMAQSLVLMLAGFETTSTSLSFLLYNLAVNPDCQQKLQKQIDEVVGDSVNVTYEMINSMPYLDMCINESLRLYPISPRTDRYCLQEITIDGVTIPKGMNVGIGIDALHYDPEVWPEPHKYDPERFSAEAKAKRDPIYFMPFSVGPRNCIGMRVAQLELRIALTKILQRFNVVPCEKTQIPLVLAKASALLKSEKGIFLKFQPRN